MNENVKLNDSVIAHFVKLLQIGLLTGTDIVDNLRTLKMCLSKDELVPSPSYTESFNDNINKMLQTSQESTEETVDEW